MFGFPQKAKGSYSLSRTRACFDCARHPASRWAPTTMSGDVPSGNVKAEEHSGHFTERVAGKASADEDKWSIELFVFARGGGRIGILFQQSMSVCPAQRCLSAPTLPGLTARRPEGGNLEDGRPACTGGKAMYLAKSLSTFTRLVLWTAKCRLCLWKVLTQAW